MVDAWQNWAPHVPDELWSDCLLLASWNTNDSNSVVSTNHSWLAETWQSIRQYASGAAYQNYIDPELANWQSAYYGANLPRLQSIKKAYDPDNLFHFRQSIPPTSGA